MHASDRETGFRGAFVAIAGITLLAAGCRQKTPPAAENAYVDPSACAGCHQKIAETYRRTGMGRAFYVPKPEDQAAATFYHKASDRYYTMLRRDGRYYQRRHQIGYDGRETNAVEKEIHFIMGSGSHARSYLHRTPQGRIVELPLGWYAERGGFWAMSPGYDRPAHQDFRRRVTYDCMFCHNGYPRLEPGAGASGRESIFPERLPEGIDCQRCHGPGGEHVRAAAAGAKPDPIRAAIVNPARLSPQRQLELCMQCHLESTSFRLPNSIQRYERDAFSYRPGQPLAAFVIHFDHPAGAGHDDKFEIAHAAWRLRKSACFQNSGGRMTCSACHNPHDIPRGAAAVEHYAQACRTCHGLDQHTRQTGCPDCHMPKRRAEDVVHTVMTDHFIQRRKPVRDLAAPLRERHENDETAYHGEVVLYYPAQLPPGPDTDLYLAVAQVKQKTNLNEGVARLEQAIRRHRPTRAEFYFDLAEAYRANRETDKAIPAYEEALRRQPDYWPAVRSLGAALSGSGDFARAGGVLQRAPADAAALHDLGLVYLRQGQPDRAIATLRGSLGADPDRPETHNALGGILWETGARAEAEKAWREAIRLQPDFAEAHNNLAQTLHAAGDFRQTQYHFEKAIQLDPKYAVARYNYGVALAQGQRFEAAQTQLGAAVRLAPGLAEAHEALGNLFARQGQLDGATRHYRLAIQSRPALASAHLGLGEVLAAQGRFREAQSHLRRAAEAVDPAIRQAAVEALEKIPAGR